MSSLLPPISVASYFSLKNSEFPFFTCVKTTAYAALSISCLLYARGALEKIFARNDGFKKSWNEKNPNRDFTMRLQTPEEISIDKQNNRDQWKSISSFAVAIFSAYMACYSWF